MNLRRENCFAQTMQGWIRCHKVPKFARRMQQAKYDFHRPFPSRVNRLHVGREDLKLCETFKYSGQKKFHIDEFFWQKFTPCLPSFDSGKELINSIFMYTLCTSYLNDASLSVINCRKRRSIYLCLGMILQNVIRLLEA